MHPPFLELQCPLSEFSNNLDILYYSGGNFQVLGGLKLLDYLKIIWARILGSQVSSTIEDLLHVKALMHWEVL